MIVLNLFYLFPARWPEPIYAPGFAFLAPLPHEETDQDRSDNSFSSCLSVLFLCHSVFSWDELLTIAYGNADLQEMFLVLQANGYNLDGPFLQTPEALVTFLITGFVFFKSFQHFLMLSQWRWGVSSAYERSSGAGVMSVFLFDWDYVQTNIQMHY